MGRVTAWGTLSFLSVRVREANGTLPHSREFVQGRSGARAGRGGALMIASLVAHPAAVAEMDTADRPGASPREGV
jgi:hypothetical protein